jgi:hypothetical protein
MEAEKKNRIDSLLAGAELSIQKGHIYLPRDHNALKNLREVLELETDNKPALAMRDDLNSRIARSASGDIKARAFEDAQLAIDALVRNGAKDSQIADLRIQLGNEQEKMDAELLARRAQQKAAEEKAEQERLAKEKADRAIAARQKSEQQRVADERRAQQLKRQKAQQQASAADQLLAQANTLGGPERVTSSNYRKLADIYNKVLQLESKNPGAIEGIAEVSDHIARQAKSAIAAHDFSTAENHIAYIKNITPKARSALELQEDLAHTRRQQEQVLEILAAADALTATPYTRPGLFGNNDKARKTYRTAFKNIESARRADAKNPALAISEEKLVNKYFYIVNIHLEDGDLDEAREFLNDLAKTKLSASTLDELEQMFSQIKEDKKGKINISSF